MKTRDKILSTALHLFNENGVSKVSSRNISEDMGISYGNLTYHFPKKEDIVLALYQQMQEKITAQFNLLEENIFGLNFALDSLKSIFKISYTYKFVFLGFAYLNREFQDIRKDTLRQWEQRKQLLEKLAMFLANNDMLRAESSPHENKSKIGNLLHLLHFWIADAEIFYQGEEDHKIGHYLDMFYNAVRPSLTPKALQIFEELYPIHK